MLPTTTYAYFYFLLFQDSVSRYKNHKIDLTIHRNEQHNYQPAMSLPTAEEQSECDVAFANSTSFIIHPKLWEEPWDFGCGHNHFKLPRPYPNLGVHERDFPWAPKTSKIVLRSGKRCFRLFAGSSSRLTVHNEEFPDGVTTLVRLRGIQRYTNGAQFEGEFYSNGVHPCQFQPTE